MLCASLNKWELGVFSSFVMANDRQEKCRSCMVYGKMCHILLQIKCKCTKMVTQKNSPHLEVYIMVLKGLEKWSIILSGPKFETQNQFIS